MKRLKLESLTNDELVKRFADICVAQDVALLYSDIAKYNRLFGMMIEVSNELKSRPGDERRALIALYDHPNAQVRLKAAKHTLAIAPASARNKIEEIANSKKGPQNGDAGMTILALDEGIFKPS